MADWTPEVLTSRFLRNRYHRLTGGVGSIRDGQKVLRGFSFEFCRDCNDAPLPKIHSHNYSITYPPLQRGDLVPFLGCLYRVGQINTEKHSLWDVGVTRLPAKEVPKGALLHPDTYTFPLNETEHNGGYISGRLHGRFIYVRRIVASTEKPDSLSAEIGLLGDISKGPGWRKSEIVWRSVGGARSAFSQATPQGLGRRSGDFVRVALASLDPPYRLHEHVPILPFRLKGATYAETIAGGRIVVQGDSVAAQKGRVPQVIVPQ